MTRQRIAELVGAEANDSAVFYVPVADGHVAVLEHTYYIHGQSKFNFIMAHVVDGQTVKKLTIKADASDKQVLNAWAKIVK